MIRNYLELIRFSHTIFALPFALASATLAWAAEPFRWQDLLGILLCMVFARSFAMAFNRLADRHIDAENPRTAGRHLPAGSLSVVGVTFFAFANAVLFVASTLIFAVREPANWWPAILAVPVLIFLAGYSYAKRFTALAHFWLGAALMLAPVAAWIAIRGLHEMAVPLLLGLAVMFWVAGFDILYASQDADYDRQKGLHSIPAKLGIAKGLRLAAICHALMIVVLLTIYSASPTLTIIYLIGIIAIALLLIYEHWLVSPHDLSRVNRAFFHVNGIISIGLFAVIVIEVLHVS
jgi:4-hydroxybenzoate polyprenyltransferase